MPEIVYDDPLRSFQFENSIEMSNQDLSQSTMAESRSNPVITSDPVGNSRIQLPYSSTISSSGESLNFGSRTYLPRNGYQILDEMPSVHIEQTFELNDNLSTINSENRFIIRSPLGEALFAASESSTERDRMIWGTKRPFKMHLLDAAHLEALTFQRRCAMGMMKCQQRYLEVWSPPGDLLGVILEENTLFTNEFTVKNEVGSISYRIKGASSNQIGFGCCCRPSEGHFDIYGFDYETIYGSITRKWSSDISQYTVNIYFTDINMPVKSKALLLGAGFLLEYLCFQSRF